MMAAFHVWLMSVEKVPVIGRLQVSDSVFVFLSFFLPIYIPLLTPELRVSASCRVRLPVATLVALGVSSENESIVDTRQLTSKKGPIVATAIIAGVMAAKRTSEIIPFCHPLPLEAVNIEAVLKLLMK